MHGPFRVPLRRWLSREICSGCHDRSLWRLWDDVAVSVHIHERCMESSGHVTPLLGVHVFHPSAVLVSLISVCARAGSHGGERSSSRTGLRGLLLAFVERLLHLDLLLVLLDVGSPEVGLFRLRRHG